MSSLLTFKQDFLTWILILVLFGFTLDNASAQTEDSGTLSPPTQTTQAMNNTQSSPPGGSTCLGPEACVYEKIFQRYNKLTRPTLQPNSSIEVTLQMVFNGLMDIEEKEEYMRSVCFFRAFWVDELLRWDPDDYSGVDMLIVPAQTIWIPDIGIANSVSSFYEITYKRDFHLQVHHDGRIRWSFGGVITTSCDIDLSLYPFDKQHCSVVVESWQYEKAKVALTLLPGVGIDLDSADPDPQWILDGAEAESFLKYNDRFSAVQFTLHWSRKPLYFYINIIVPSTFMGLITLGVFWLPAECGEKMSLGITVMLAFSVFQIVIMEITPVSSDAVPKITELVLTVMTLATSCLLSSMVVAYMREIEYPPPHWVRKLFLYYIPRLTRLSFYHDYKQELGHTEGKHRHVKTMKTKDIYQKYFGEDGQTLPVSPARTTTSVVTSSDEDRNTWGTLQLDAVKLAEQQQIASDRQVRQEETTMQDTYLMEQHNQKGHNQKVLHQQENQSVVMFKTDKAKRMKQSNGVVSSRRQYYSHSSESYTGKERKEGTKKKGEKEFVVRDIKKILSLLERMKEKRTKAEQDARIREEWKYIGRSFDMLVFWLCVVAFSVFIIYIVVAIRGGL